MTCAQPGNPLNHSSISSNFCQNHIVKSVIRPTAKPIAAPIAAPRGPPTRKPMPAPVKVAPNPMRVALQPSISFLMASMIPVIYIGIPRMIPATPAASPAPNPAEVCNPNFIPSLAIANAISVLQTFPNHVIIALPRSAAPAVPNIALPTISPKLNPSRPFSMASFIAMYERVIPVIANVIPIAIENEGVANRVLSVAMEAIKVFVTFHAKIPVPIPPTSIRIRPNRVSNSSLHESISSVMPSHSFISLTIADTLVSASPDKKSYSGNLKLMSPKASLTSAELSSLGLITLSSSNPSIYDLSFFASSAALSNASPVPSAALVIEFTPE